MIAAVTVNKNVRLVVQFDVEPAAQQFGEEIHVLTEAFPEITEINSDVFFHRVGDAINSSISLCTNITAQVLSLAANTGFQIFILFVLTRR